MNNRNDNDMSLEDKIEQSMASFSSFNHLKLKVGAHNSIRNYELYNMLHKDIFATFGNGSYAGSLFCRPDRDCQHIFIGNYCCLSDDVTFMIGANHEYDFVSNYCIGQLFPYNKEVKNSSKEKQCHKSKQQSCTTHACSSICWGGEEIEERS